MTPRIKIPTHCAHDKLVAANKLKPHPQNPNRHPSSQIELLAQVIQATGWRAAVTVSSLSGCITRGHGRHEAALLIGKTTPVPTDYQDYADEHEELADMLADNRIAELAEMDRTALKDALEQLDDGAFDMALTGFDQAALEELMTAAPPDMSNTEAGQTLDEKLATFLDGSSRQLVLIYAVEQFERVAANLEKLRTDTGAESNAAAIDTLLEETCADL